MVTRKVVFHCDESLHMKIVAILIQKASTYRSSVWLGRGDRRANAKSLLGVMSLGLEPMCDVDVTVEGPDEEEALDAICRYLEKPET